MSVLRTSKKLLPLFVGLSLSAAVSAGDGDRFELPVAVKTLDNGLTVVVSEDRSAPVVGVSVVYKVGMRLRTEEPHRLRAPVRAPDVRRHAERAGRHLRQGDHRRRRAQQRVDAPRLHQLHRDGAGVGAGTDPVARSRPHDHARLQRQDAEEPAGRGQGRNPRQREEPALRRLHVDRHRPAGVLEVGKQPRRLRQLRRSGKRQARRRAGLPPRLLRPQQRGALAGRRRDARNRASRWPRSTSARSPGAKRRSARTWRNR
jgi:hypothetical protein